MSATLLESPNVNAGELPGESDTGLRLDVLTDDHKALREWRALEVRLENPYLFCSWDWVETWIGVFGKSLPHRFLRATVDGQTVGMALLVSSRQWEGPIPVRTLHFGTAGEPVRDSVFVEYNRPLVESEYMAAFADALRDHAEADRNWDRLHYDGLADDIVPVLVPDPGSARLRKSPCHYFDLSAARAAGKSVLESLGSSTRRNIRQNLRQLGELTLDWSETPDQANEIFDDLIRLHQSRWAADGQPGCYSSEPFTRFHRQLIPRLVPQGKMVLTRVRRGNDPIGCVQLFVKQNHLLFYQCGSARLGAKLSAGLITDYLSMQAGLDRGYDAYDFLAGDSVHKRKLSTHAREVVWATWQRPRWKFPVIDFLRGLKRRVRPAKSGLVEPPAD